jgi:hypothetical protein
MSKAMKSVRRAVSLLLLVTLMSFGSSPSANAAPIPVVVNCSISGSFTVEGNVVTGNTACVGVAAIPDTVTSIGNFAFYLNSGLTRVTFGPGSQLASIGESAFLRATALTTIALPGLVSSIGRFAFQFTTSLNSITIPNLVSTIGEGAFVYTTSLTSISLPSSLTTITRELFQSSSITSLTVPNLVTTIEERAFISTSSLTTINLPASTTSIAADAFTNTSALTAINVDAANPIFSSIDGVVFNKAGTTLLRYPEGKVGNPYQMPSTVTSIATNAFPYSSNPIAFTYAGEMSDAALEAAGATGNITFSSLTLLDLSSTIQIANFDNQSTYTASSSAGTATISSTGLITITGLSPDQTATVTVTRRKSSYIPRMVSTSVRSQVAPMLPTNKPAVTISDNLITCTIGSYSAAPTSAAFSLFIDGKHISTNFSALGEYLPDWIIPWASTSTITRTATLSTATWPLLDAYKGKAITCATLGYSKYAIGFTASQVLVAR